MKFLIKLVALVIIGGGIYFYTQYNKADMTSQESIDKSFEYVKTVLDENDLVTLLEFKGESLTTASNRLCVTMYKQDGDSMVMYEIGLSGDNQFIRKMDDDITFKNSAIYENRKKQNPKTRAIPFKDIDVSQMSEYIDKAAGMLAELKEEDDTNSYTFDGLGTYAIKLNPDPAKIEHEFAIQSIQSVASKSAKRREISYIETDFKAKGGEVSLRN